MRDRENGTDESEPAPPMVEIDELIGRSFLMEPKKDGTRNRATVVRLIDDFQAGLDRDPEWVRFVATVGKEEAEEIFSYNQILEHLEQDRDFVWKFKSIVAHQGPLNRNSPDYKGSPWNAMVEWENGEITCVPLSNIAVDDPVTCTIYAREHNLLEHPGWKRFKKLARRGNKLLCTVNHVEI